MNFHINSIYTPLIINIIKLCKYSETKISELCSFAKNLTTTFPSDLCKFYFYKKINELGSVPNDFNSENFNIGCSVANRKYILSLLLIKYKNLSMLIDKWELLCQNIVLAQKRLEALQY